MDLGSLGLGKKQEETFEDASLRQERAEELHQETIVVDGHQGTLFDVLYGARNLGEEGPGHVDLPRLRKAGVRLSILTAFLADRRYPRRGVRTGLEYIDAFRSLGDLPGAMLCTNSDQVEEARRQDKVGFMLGFEGGEFLDASIEALRMFARQGLRLLTLTWSERNELADGAAESGTRGGLTTFGKNVVRECGRLGVMVDVSHISEGGFWDVIDMAEAPIVASHSNCHAIYGHPRNLTDDQLKSIAETGGVVAITLNPEYLAIDGGDITLGTVCDHVLHALEVAGEDHVALGSDFDTFTGDVPLNGVDELPFLTAELLKRGVSGKALAGVLGGNWMRVIRAICK